MSRDNLMLQYAALNTPDLPQRIFNEIKKHIDENGIDNLPCLDVNGRHTGKITISDGGWRGDFDFLYPVLSLCRIDRKGEVSPDIVKIERRVSEWRDWLITPTQDDALLGVDDRNFDPDNYDDDDVNEFRSAAYAAEFDSFIKSELPDIREHDAALAEIDRICDGRINAIDRQLSAKDEMWNSFDDEDAAVHEEVAAPMFEEGYSVQRIDNPEQLRKLMEALARDADEYGGETWINPDFDIDQFFAEQEQMKDEQPSWLEFVDNLRNGRFGELPEDYDGLAEE